MKKKSGVLILSFMLCLLFTASAFAADTTQYTIDLEGKKIDGQALVSEGRLYLPLRAVCSPLGYKISWFGKEGKLVLAKDGMAIELGLENFKLKVNDHESYVADVYKRVNGTSYLSEGFFEENLGLEVIQEGGAVSITAVKENPISIKTVRDTAEDDYIKITLQYPQLEGLENKDVQDQLNDVFKQAAQDSRNAGLKNAEEMKKFFEAGYTGSPNKCETYFNYLVKYNQKGLLSIVLMDYQYTGGAHGLTIQSSATFDLATGKEYQLKDIFTEGTDYVKLVSREIKKAMEEQGIADSLLNPFEAISPEQDYYLTNDALVVYFQAYEYLPYAYGIPEFAIDYPILQDNFKPAFEILN